MLNRIPAAILQAISSWARLALTGLLAATFLALPTRSAGTENRLVAMPSTPSFSEAYEIALSLAEQVPGSRVMTVASTYSMYPTLDWDSIVVIVPASLEQIKVGDVICFRDRRLDGVHTVLHRVEKILPKDHRLVTRGDALERADPHFVTADALVGKATHAVYFDRANEKRPVAIAQPTPLRRERVTRL